jgi:4-amino-4-deoxy-L-arabinose transferase-like glycosyltransferase
MGLIATSFVLLALTYSVVTPVFEASDEISHYPVVEYVATTGQLPVQVRGEKTLWEQEGSQPPMYYMISAALTFWIDTTDLETVQTRNPHAKLGIPLDFDNRNMILHTSGEDFPWHGSVLAVHLIRFFSISLGLVSVVATYALATEVSSDQNVRLLAASITAFNPMFLFITGSVNNDNLIVATSTIILLLLVKSLKYGLTTYRIVVVAVLLAFGSITKISGLTLYPLAGIVALVISIRAKDYTLLVRAGVWVVVAWLLVAGWWYLRNLICMANF